mgnify:CR=1 FL=1
MVQKLGARHDHAANPEELSQASNVISLEALGLIEFLG